MDACEHTAELGHWCFRHRLLLGGQRYCGDTKTDCPDSFQSTLFNARKIIFNEKISLNSVLCWSIQPAKLAS